MAEPAAVILQDAQTTGNGTISSYFHNCTQVSFLVQPNGSVSAGVITFETAITSDYSGTWAAVASTSAVTTTGTTTITRTLGPYPWVRARISTNVAGGTVTVLAIGC